MEKWGEQMKKGLLVLSTLLLLSMIFMTIYYQKKEPALTPEQALSLSSNTRTAPEKVPEETLQGTPVTDEIAYSLQQDKLQITYNNGQEWVGVPVDKSNLFSGEYNGNQQELIANSFILNEQYAAFLYWNNGVQLIYSTDKGSNWQESLITDQVQPIRYRKIAFLSDDFWYAVISYGRTMSSEGASIYITNDQGESWRETNMPNTTRLVANGGFVTEQIGVMAYGTINPAEPDMHVTNDGGATWQKATFEMPSKYDGVFVTPNVPYQEEDHLALIMEQGPNGDYGNIQAKFISKDNGLTWEFVEEVEPDNEQNMD